MQTHPWLFDVIDPEAATDPALAAELLGLCGDLLTAAFLVVQAQAPSLARQQTLAHLGAALGEVEAARGWQGEEG
jgi:hypothetical protein